MNKEFRPDSADLEAVAQAIGYAVLQGLQRALTESGIPERIAVAVAERMRPLDLMPQGDMPPLKEVPELDALPTRSAAAAAAAKTEDGDDARGPTFTSLADPAADADPDSIRAKTAALESKREGGAAIDLPAMSAAQSKQPTSPTSVNAVPPPLAALYELPPDSGSMLFRARRHSDGAKVVVRCLDAALGGDRESWPALRGKVVKLRRVHHANVAQVLGDAIHDGRYCVVTEAVAGRSLAELMAGRLPMAEVDVLRVMIEACTGLQQVYLRSDVLHGALVPECIEVAFSGIAGLGSEGEEGKVDGFVGPRIPWSDPTGVLPGERPLYVAPEILAGGYRDLRSDLYALGAIMYHLLTGKLPADGDAAEVRAAHLDPKVPDPGEVRPRLHSLTRQIVTTAMARDYTSRYLNHQGFIVACEKAMTVLSGGTYKSLRILRKPLRSVAKRSQYLTPLPGDEVDESDAAAIAAAAAAEVAGDQQPEEDDGEPLPDIEPGLSEPERLNRVTTRILSKHRRRKSRPRQQGHFRRHVRGGLSIGRNDQWLPPSSSALIRRHPRESLIEAALDAGYQGLSLQRLIPLVVYAVVFSCIWVAITSITLRFLR